MPERETLRLMAAGDIPSAAQLSAEAGWNQTAEDWRMLLELASDSCFAIEMEGKLAATTTLVCYGRRLAWIGMVLTAQQYRGRGFARQLLAEALAQADRRQIESVKLDATDQGKPLYEKMGFRFEQIVERWARLGPNNPGEVAPSVRPTRDWNEDSEAFGADRSHLLTKLAARNPPTGLPHSFLLTRPGRQAAYLGPCVGKNSEVAELVEGGLKSASTSTWYWDLLPQNAKAVILARNLGFSPQRRLARMVRGNDLQGKEDAIYAIAGFELG
jgi:GNAT superfamily N-acetyltransferase